MKKTNTLVLSFIIVVAIVLLYFLGSYNGLIKKSEAVDAQWAQLETQYQRRMDLIPNLVNTVKGYMQFESTLLQNITSLRTRWMTAQTPRDKIDAAQQMDGAISRLLLTYENYPELKSQDNVRALMDELSGTENRISVERKRYNEAVQSYNIAVKVFPSNVVAGIAGFSQKDYFKSVLGSDTPPQVNI